MERYEAYKDSGVEWIGEIPYKGLSACWIDDARELEASIAEKLQKAGL